MTAREKLLYDALIEARALIGCFLEREDVNRSYIDTVNKQIEDTVEYFAGGPVDGAGELLALSDRKVIWVNEFSGSAHGYYRREEAVEWANNAVRVAVKYVEAP